MAPTIVKIAGGVLLGAGVFGAFHVLQLMGIVSSIRGAFVAVPPAMGVASAIGLIAGIGLARSRGWAGWAAIAAGALLWVTSSVWFLFAIVNGLFTLFGLLVPGMAFAALVLAVLARNPCEATALARKRLAEHGLDLGV